MCYRFGRPPGTAGSSWLQTELHFAFSRRHFKAARFVIFEDGIDNGLGLINQLHQIHVIRADHFFGDQYVAEPVHHTTPESATDQNDGNLARFASLNEGERFGEFIQRAKTTGHHHIGRGMFDKHDLARKKVAEALAHILIRVAALLVR